MGSFLEDAQIKHGCSLSTGNANVTRTCGQGKRRGRRAHGVLSRGHRADWGRHTQGRNVGSGSGKYSLRSKPNCAQGRAPPAGSPLAAAPTPGGLCPQPRARPRAPRALAQTHGSHFLSVLTPCAAPAPSVPRRTSWNHLPSLRGDLPYSFCLHSAVAFPRGDAALSRADAPVLSHTGPVPGRNRRRPHGELVRWCLHRGRRIFRENSLKRVDEENHKCLYSFDKRHLLPPRRAVTAFPPLEMRDRPHQPRGLPSPPPRWSGEKPHRAPSMTHVSGSMRESVRLLGPVRAVTFSHNGFTDASSPEFSLPDSLAGGFLSAVCFRVCSQRRAAPGRAPSTGPERPLPVLPPRVPGPGHHLVSHATACSDIFCKHAHTVFCDSVAL